MNRRERVSVSIPCFGIRFSAVLYITNAPSIQMIQQLLGSPVVYQFYDMRCLVREASPPPRDTQLPFETWFITTIYTYLYKEVVYHEGGQYRIRKSWNLYILFQRNALMDIKITIIDICYANTAPILKTLMFFLLRKWKI